MEIWLDFNCLVLKDQVSFKSNTSTLKTEHTKKSQRNRETKKKIAKAIKKKENSIATIPSYGQARKSIGRMPWHWEPMKDVVSCEKLRGGANIR